MTEPAEPVPPPDADRRPLAKKPMSRVRRAVRRRKRAKQVMSLAQSGFLLSAVLAIINVFYAIQGSTIVVQKPEQVILYRDGEGASAVLTMAMRLAMINTTTQAGDVLMTARLVPVRGGPSFAYAATVKPVFTRDADTARQCQLGARCIVHPGLVAIEHGDDIIDLPGGSVRGAYLSYPMAGWNCEGTDKACTQFGDFAAAVRSIGGKPLAVTVRINFYGDGHRDLYCATNPVNARYLAQKGWVTMSCQSSAVFGAPWF